MFEFSTVHMVKSHFLLENLWLSETYYEKIQIFEEIRKFWLGFTAVIYVKIYLEALINNQHNWLKNNTA